MYENLIDFELVSDNPYVRWKPEIEDWIAYNIKYPVYLESELSEDNVLTVDILLTDEKDAVLFKLFWG